MSIRSTCTLPCLFLAFLMMALIFPATGNAGKTTRVDKVFRGQLLISDEALPPPNAADVKGTIKSYKAKTLKVIKGKVLDGVATWNFHFVAFMKTKPKQGDLVVEFYTDDKEKRYVADKRFDGIDPNGTILAASVRISEDENLMRGRKYIVKLVANRGNKSVVLASAKISTE